MDLYFYTQEQRRMDRGRMVVNALHSIGGEGTVEHLLEEISSRIDQPEELIEPELKKVLNQAIRDGFLIKNGRTYLFPSVDHEPPIDGRIDAKRKRDRSRSGTREYGRQTPRKRVRFTNILSSPSKPQLKPTSKSRSRSRS